MRIIHIVPASNRDLVTDQTMNMLLTHLVEQDVDYRNWAKALTGYKILDNSLIELGGSVTIERILAAAEAIGADEIILPDVFQDGNATYEAAAAAIGAIQDAGLIGKYKLMAVAQGSSLVDFERCYNLLASLADVDVIGIPKVTAKMHPAGRSYFSYLFKNSSVQIHFLGLWYAWFELFQLPVDVQCRIRSVDTCLCAYQTKYNLHWSETRPDGFTLDLQDTSLSNECLGAAITDLNSVARLVVRGFDYVY